MTGSRDTDLGEMTELNKRVDVGRERGESRMIIRFPIGWTMSIHVYSFCFLTDPMFFEENCITPLYTICTPILCSTYPLQLSDGLIILLSVFQ